jgi:hypothetical protein
MVGEGDGGVAVAVGCDDEQAASMSTASSATRLAAAAQLPLDGGRDLVTR